MFSNELFEFAIDIQSIVNRGWKLNIEEGYKKNILVFTKEDKSHKCYDIEDFQRFLDDLTE